jgi:protease-4|nr:MAG: signal peptide peptidase SppA [Pseudomonadota bacterium]
MSLDTETILDRRRVRRQLSFWRVLAVIALTLAAGALLVSSESGLLDRRQIARVSLEGMITEDRDFLKLLDRIGEAENVAGVIVYVNSPGGTTTGGEAIYSALRRLSEKKPVVAQFGTVAASAAYIAGLGTDYIVARGNTITGSIGVVMQWPEISGFLDKIGVKVNEVKSGPLKSNPSPFQPLDETGRALAESMIAESHQWFLDLVRTRRQVTTSSIPGLEQGRVFSGREALQHKLIDEIGGEPEAIRWLEGRGVEKGLKVVDWKERSGTGWGLGSIAGLARYLGGDLMAELTALLTRDRTLGAFRLDGLVSVWQPSEN